MSERWDEAKQRLVKDTIDKEAAKLAKRLGALQCLVIGFFVDPMDAEVSHMSVVGEAPYPHYTVLGRIAELNPGSEQSEMLSTRHRFPPALENATGRFQASP